MEGWAAQELQYAQLGDARRNKRLVRVVEDLAAQPNESVPQALVCQSASAAMCAIAPRFANAFIN